MRAVRNFVFLPLLIMLTATLLIPIIETDLWWVRFLDFPRVQLLGGLAVSLVAFVAFGGFSSLIGKAAIALAVIGGTYQLPGITPYILPSERVNTAENACMNSPKFTVLVANVQKDNRLQERFFDMVRQSDPDILLVLETDEWWDKKLKELRPEFPNFHQQIPEKAEFYGMHLMSKFQLVKPTVKTYVDINTPTIISNLILPGEQTINFIGIHPRPPNMGRQPSTKRDANMMAAALDAKDAKHPTIMAGDFNATPWERTMRRTLRIGNLEDPRIGRGLIPTYSTKNVAMAWALDHIVAQPSLSFDRFERLPPFGSDHYAVLAELCINDQNIAASDVSQADLAEAEKTLQHAREMNQ